ncbi:uncharacterized protein LOC142333966 isoform X2 [Lycorma delicatula]|uniref:uncharacterized protein LOC142333966 isoform X2 n=1 Tax=Lycorma delicatula TaxID=130591 RepID=UPI003F51330B
MERKDYLYNVDEKEHFYKIDLSLFIISLLIVLSKAVIGYWSSLPSIFNSSYDVSDNFLSSIFSSIIELWIPVEWIIKPILIGLMMSFITWQIIYLDSDLPGVRPSTPFTYNKYYKRMSVQLETCILEDQHSIIRF